MQKERLISTKTLSAAIPPFINKAMQTALPTAGNDYGQECVLRDTPCAVTCGRRQGGQGPTSWTLQQDFSSFSSREFMACIMVVVFDGAIVSGDEARTA